MNNFMDKLWEQIEGFLNLLARGLDTLVSPLEFFGPVVVIFALSFLVVGFTRLIAQFYVTKRFLKLKKEFEHWQGVREEAMKHPDREKAKALAKNIDQAQLNKAYYDYFFEGLLKNLVTNVLPVLLMVAYVTKVYTPHTLLSRFGDKWVFTLFPGTSSQIHFSSLFWFVISLMLSYILFAVFKKMIKKNDKKKQA